MAKNLGYNLSWGSVKKSEILNASILSVDDYKVLIDILKNVLLLFNKKSGE